MRTTNGDRKGTMIKKITNLTKGPVTMPKRKREGKYDTQSKEINTRGGTKNKGEGHDGEITRGKSQNRGNTAR